MGSSTGQRTAIAQTLITIERFMREHGLDYQRAARAVGIDPAVARVPDARVPLRNLAQLLENVARETDNDAFGAQVGASFRPGTTGTLDYVISNAPTLRVALNDYVRFLALVSDHLDPRLEEGPWMSYMVTPLPASFGPSAQLMDAQTAVRIARIRHIMRDPSFPLQVELKRAKPRALGEFRRIFGQRVRFEQAENRIGIATRALDKELPAADPQLYRVLVQAAKTALSERLVAAHPISRVTSYIGAGLAHGKVSLAAAARAADLSRHALRRQLSQSGTTFRALVLEIRKAMAEHYIKETALPLTEIAFLLGFSELSAFSRAAKQWFGRTPRELRKRGPRLSPKRF
jgi:AraC-like DNA-binding protein